MKLTILFLVFLHASPAEASASISKSPKIWSRSRCDREIHRLLRVLYPGPINNALHSPDDRTTWSVQKSLEAIGRRSGKARMQVIRAVILLMDDLENRPSFFYDPAWQMASNVLVDLKATEAIDALVRHFDQAMSVVSLTMSGYPPARALYQMGKIAIPRLTQLLHVDDPVIRVNSASALSLIGGENAERTLRDALINERDEETKTRIEYALSRLVSLRR